MTEPDLAHLDLANWAEGSNLRPVVDGVEEVPQDEDYFEDEA